MVIQNTLNFICFALISKNASARYARLVKYVILYRIRLVNFALCLFIKIMNFIEIYFGYIYTFDSVSEASVINVHNVIIVCIVIHC